MPRLLTFLTIPRKILWLMSSCRGINSSIRLFNRHLRSWRHRMKRRDLKGPIKTHLGSGSLNRPGGNMRLRSISINTLKRFLRKYSLRRKMVLLIFLFQIVILGTRITRKISCSISSSFSVSKSTISCKKQEHSKVGTFSKHKSLQQPSK